MPELETRESISQCQNQRQGSQSLIYDTLKTIYEVKGVISKVFPQKEANFEMHATYPLELEVLASVQPLLHIPTNCCA